LKNRKADCKSTWGDFRARPNGGDTAADFGQCGCGAGRGGPVSRDVYAGIRVKDQKSYFFGIEAAEPGRFPQLLIGGQKDTSWWGVFAPSEGRC